MKHPFNPRLSAPLITDLHWVHYTKGGHNRCLLIKNDSVLPNCVGYAWGRWSELLSIDLGFTRHQLSTGNAENWFTKNDGYERGQEPKLGAIACWRKGLSGVSKDGFGHVSVVEDILNDGSIVTSNSAYLGSRFYMRTIKPPYVIPAEVNAEGYVFQGFIYLPIEFTPNNKVDMKSIDLIAKEVIDGRWGNGADRKARLLAAGYNPAEVQEKVNELLVKEIVIPKKTIDEIAKEVIDGKWGSGILRRVNLIKAGYNYQAVQTRVNQLLTPVSAKKTIDEIAKEVIAGKWGSGLARKQALVKAGYNYTTIQKRVNQLLK